MTLTILFLVVIGVLPAVMVAIALAMPMRPHTPSEV